MKYVNMLLLSFIVLSVYAQTETKKFSLQEAVNYAKSNNASLKSSRLDIKIAEQKVREITAMGLPNVSASGGFNNNVKVAVQALPNFLKGSLVGSAAAQAEYAYRQSIGNPAQLTPAQEQELQKNRSLAIDGVNREVPDQINAGFGVPYSLNGTITASQLIFDGTYLMGLKASKEFVNLSKINATRTEVETEVNVSKAYYLALVMETNLKLLNKNIETLSKTADEIEKISAAGLVDKIEADRIKLQLNSLSLQRDKIADQQKLSLMVLKFQMGLNVNENIQLTDNLESLYQKKKTPLIDTKFDINARPEYQLLKQQERLNLLDKKRYQYAYAPSLAGFFTHQQNSFGNKVGDLGGTWFPGTLWGLSLRIPIYEGFKKDAQIKQAVVALEKNKNDIANLENALEQEVFMAKTTYQRTSEQIKIQEKNLALAQEVYNRVEVKYKNGVGSALDLTTSQNDLETARANYLTTVYEFFVAEIELQKALGNLK